jgi:hypothetical protein
MVNDIQYSTPPEKTQEKILYSLEAEAALCGCVLISPDIFPTISIEVVDFFNLRHRWLWQAITRLTEEDTAVDNITIGDWLERADKLVEAGGPGYIAQLIANAPPSFNVTEYAKIIKEFAARRRLLDIAGQAAKQAFTGSMDGDVSRISAKMADLDDHLHQKPVGLEAISPSKFLEIPPLPEAARVDPALGIDACPWLDDYVAFSRKWSPRAYDSFHEACALWLLSTVAARRVFVHLGKPRFTNLYLALTARTSLYAKSSTAEIPLQLIHKAGLSYLLAADSATPQKFVSDLTTKLVNNYDGLDVEQQEYARLRVATAGQRGWYYDEFGQHIAAMMRDGGFMADFRGLLRRLDDTPERYEYGSISRGSDVVERPYLALLANLTPDDLKPHARRGSGLWGDGFLGRFALITPPEDDRRRDRFPKGERIIPGDILTPIVKWHDRLGLPDVAIEDVYDKDDKPTGAKRLQVSEVQLEALTYGQDVFEAFYAYHDGLLDILQDSTFHDLDGSYCRLGEKALRVATLLASVSGSATIEMNHWSRAVEIAERWRAGLHELYNQLNEPDESIEHQMEEKLLSIVQKLGGATAAVCARNVRNLSAIEAGRYLDGLAEVGLLTITTTKKNTRKYKING